VDHFSSRFEKQLKSEQDMKKIDERGELVRRLEPTRRWIPLTHETQNNAQKSVLVIGSWIELRSRN